MRRIFCHAGDNNYSSSGVIFNLNCGKCFVVWCTVDAWNRSSRSTFALISKSECLWCWLFNDFSIRVQLVVLIIVIYVHHVSVSFFNHIMLNNFNWNDGIESNSLVKKTYWKKFYYKNLFLVSQLLRLWLFVYVGMILNN